MKLFEPLARLSRRCCDDYAAAAQAGIGAVFEASAPHGPPRLNAGTFEDDFGALLRWEPARASAAGLEHSCALGLHGREAHDPSLADAVLWLLPRLLGKDNVAAVGELGLDEGTAQEEEALARQLELARRRQLPVIVRVQRRGGARSVERHLALVAESRLPPELVLLVGLEEPSLAVARAAGCWSCLAVGRRAYPAALAPVLRRRWGLERLLLSGEPDGCGGDLLAVPAAAAALRDAGEPSAVIERLLWDNPRRFFAQSRRAVEAS